MSLKNGYREYWCPDCQRVFWVNVKRHDTYNHLLYKISCIYCGLTMPRKWFEQEKKTLLESDG